MSHSDLLNVGSTDYFREDDNKADQAKRLARDIGLQLAAAIDNRGRASIAFSGGSTPSLMFTALAKESVEWSKVAITLVD